LLQKEGLELQVEADGDEVTLQFMVDLDTEREDVRCEIHPTRLSVALKGDLVLEGHFPNDCQADLDGRVPWKLDLWVGKWPSSKKRWFFNLCFLRIVGYDYDSATDLSRVCFDVPRMPQV
jgi:hypothetical protein